MNVLKRPMFFAAIICSLAAVISLYYKSIAFGLLGCAISVFVLLIFLKKYKYITVAIAILVFSVSLFCEFSQIEKIEKYDNKNISGEFLVVEEPDKSDEYYTFVLKVSNCDSLPQNSKYIVFDYKKTKLKMGDIVSANIELDVISKYNEYRLYDYSNGIYATAVAKKVIKTGDKNTFYNVAGKIRGYVKNSISTRFSGNTAGLLLAVTTGDKSLISDRFSSKVKTTGISHVIVVSGMHLSIIMAAIFWLFDRLFYNKYLRSFLSIAFVVAILAIGGFTMSITRAGVMFIIAGLAPIFSRENDSLSSLFTAITGVLILAPFAIANISFLLSVLSTLAIIWAVPFYHKRIVEKFNIKSKILDIIIGIFLCSTFAIIFTLPVTIKTFGFVSIVSPITNMLITYPITIALIVNVFALITGAIPFVKYISYPLFWIAGMCSKFTVYIVNLIAQLPITVAVLPKVAFWWSIALLVLIIGYMYYYEYKRKRSDLIANYT